MLNIDEIIKYQNNPKRFIQDFCLKKRLLRHQHDIIDFYQNEKINIFLKCRQLGFTTISLGFAYWLSLFNKDTNIVFLVNNFAHSSSHFLQMIHTWHTDNKNDFFSRIKITNSSGRKIEFENGSRIQIAPHSIDAVHGEKVDLLVLDEFAYCTDLENKWKSYFPCSAQGKIFAHSSLPVNQSKDLIDFWETVSSIEDINTQIFNRLVDESKDYNWYKDQIKLMGKAAAKAELDCKFTLRRK